ncbi:hypothetical protein FRC17_007559 [Serendipita sp. 399]|nr:hypothetical protein FRC17_007559 [Serendipita sp. 399]
MQMTEEERIEASALYGLNASCYASIIEIGLSFGDGSLGRWSLWMAPSTSITTLIVNCVIGYMSGRTEKPRRGTTILPFIYGYPVAIISALLTFLWIATSVVILIRIHQLNPKREIVRVVEAAFAVLNATLTATEGISFLYYRRKFLITTKIRATERANTRTLANDNRSLPRPRLVAPIPPLQSSPPPTNPVDPNVSKYPHGSVNPLYVPANPSVTGAGPNPAYQPPHTTMTTTAVYLMMQKDVGE